MRRPSLRGFSILALLVVACGLAAAYAWCQWNRPPAVSGPIRTIVSFGDSLSDVGTYNPSAADPDPARRGTAGQRFTTKPGEVWVEVVAERLGLALEPNQRVDFGPGGRILDLGGTGYAQGGAHIDTDADAQAAAGIVAVAGNAHGPGDAAVPGDAGVPGDAATAPVRPGQGATAISIKAQIDRYLARYRRFDDSELVLVQGGGNDFLDALQALGEAGAAPVIEARLEHLVQARAAAMVAQVRRLIAAGARRVVYVNLPDLGMLPFIRDTELEEAATAVSSGYNRLVAWGLAGTGVQIFDLAELIDTAVANPAAVGLTVTDKPACTSFDAEEGQVDALQCTPATLAEPDADQRYLFADAMHPTAAGHRLWGRRVAEFVSRRFGVALGAERIPSASTPGASIPTASAVPAPCPACR